MTGGFRVILAFLVGFATAQVIKFICGAMNKKIRKKEMKDFRSAMRYLFKSGGMPSGHASSTVAVATLIGCIEGFDSLMFGLAVTIVLTVVYDAVNVRYAVGEQGKILNILSPKKTRIVEGHTVLQVMVGVFLGIGIGLLLAKIS